MAGFPWGFDTVFQWKREASIPVEKRNSALLHRLPSDGGNNGAFVCHGHAGWPQVRVGSRDVERWDRGAAGGKRRDADFQQVPHNALLHEGRGTGCAFLKRGRLL
ncbi:hypothetical protein SKAU_G00363840 [Synaphobranchus kaupii]|uniref:Uncharacterized protein n=1 Tax=Synaphobranchus kaupii TaxID=118154 RepID=A0A9Q1IF74_SYNKA|nr:hypothetical protein SKAU_G00363840 [Synaphobranchus kaupii]